MPLVILSHVEKHRYQVDIIHIPFGSGYASLVPLELNCVQNERNIEYGQGNSLGLADRIFGQD